MSDPAEVAAQRAFYAGSGLSDNTLGHMTSAAREALKPIREVHYPRPGSVCAMYPEPLCNCGEEWKDCPTAKLIYSTEEMNR